MRTVVLVLLCAVGTSGCAVAAAKGPGPGPVRADRKPDCNDGKGAVVLDGLGATVLGVSALAAFAAEEGGVGAALGLASVGLIASAVSGSRSADRCRLAEQQWEGLLMANGGDARPPRQPAPGPVLVDEDGDPIAPSPRPIAVAPPVVAPVRPTPVRPTSVTPPVATVRPPTPTPATPTPVAPTPAAGDGDGDDDDDDDDPPTSSDDPGDWSAFWREVTR